MVPNVFAQIDVTVTPYKESHYIDELNWVTVELSKVVPNTDFCIQFIQNNVVLQQYPSSIENSSHMFNTVDKDADYYGSIYTSPEFETGNYQVRVFYGECNAENSFGNGYAIIMLQKEPSNVSKFIQDNYFPERIDVGIDYQKDELFTYPHIHDGCVRVSEDVRGSNNVCGIESAVRQTWDLDSTSSQQDVEVIITTGDIRISDDSKHLLGVGTESDEFRCYLGSGSLGYCFSDNLLVKMHSTRGGQLEIWMPAILDKIKSNPIPSQSKLSSMYSTQSVDTTTSVDQWVSGDSLSIGNNECGKGTVLKNNVCVVELTCGKGTIEKNGQCVVDNSSSGGGCLIATATYGSEMATEVQQLRELRDNQLLQTESGAAFMSTFNDVYYSFSPIIADYERENPYFKEAVKLAITPMISTLSLMENAESESEVLGIGISIIMLNLGMYLGIPAIVVIGIRKNIPNFRET